MSVINGIKARINTVPEVGMGATILMYSDRYAATIVRVHENGKTVYVQRDHAVRTDSNGISESQEYQYSPNANATIETYTLRSNGRWIRKGESMKHGTGLSIGSRDEYYDFSF